MKNEKENYKEKTRSTFNNSNSMVNESQEITERRDAESKDMKIRI